MKDSEVAGIDDNHETEVSDHSGMLPRSTPSLLISKSSAVILTVNDVSEAPYRRGSLTWSSISIHLLHQLERHGHKRLEKHCSNHAVLAVQWQTHAPFLTCLSSHSRQSAIIQ